MPVGNRFGLEFPFLSKADKVVNVEIADTF